MATNLAASHVIDFSLLLAPQVGLEPTTLRLTAVGPVPQPAATGCYNVLSFVHFSLYLLGRNCYLYCTNYDRF